MRPPRIGIPLGLDDRGRWRPGRDYLYIDHRYAQAISTAGGIPIHLPIQKDIGSLVEDIDGLLLPGGDDLAADVARGERSAPDGVLDCVPTAQLDFDLALLEAVDAEVHPMPILGICYGMQLLVRRGGGRLIVHLPTECPDANAHKLAEPDARHEITIESDSRLARIHGAVRGSVNSLHHQAIASVGARHRIVARAADGVIEAIEATAGDASGGPPFEIGVQWHPEKLDSPESRALFADFVSACSERASRRQDR